jgi:hypothetical protein
MDNTQIAARGFILDYLRHGPAEALAVYNAAQKFLGLDGPEISAALLSLNVHVHKRDGETIVELPENVVAIWWWAKRLPCWTNEGRGDTAA